MYATICLMGRTKCEITGSEKFNVMCSGLFALHKNILGHNTTKMYKNDILSLRALRNANYMCIPAATINKTINTKGEMDGKNVGHCFHQECKNCDKSYG